MKFYITIEGIPKLKRSFLNLKLFSIINIPDILQEHGYSLEKLDQYSYFIVAQKIEKLIDNYSKSKRIRGIIYCNPNLSEPVIENLFDSLEQNRKITEVVLLDDYNVPRAKHLYHLFPEIIFFPSVRKIRLVECKPIQENVIWKIPES